MTWVYEYEDHAYPSQKRANAVMPEYICKPGTHHWLVLIMDGAGPEVCKKCGLVRFKK